MKRRLLAAASVLVLSFGVMSITQPAYAIFGLGDIVYDPSNFAENVLTAARTLEMINNQITQLTNEAQMLTNMAKELQNLPFSAASDLQRTLSGVDTLIQSAEGLAYQVSTIETEYRRLFPETFASGTTTAQIIANAEEAWSQARAGYKHALEVQAQIVGTVAEDAPLLDRLVSESQAAVGNLQAVQAGNQLTALAAKQSMQLQELLAAQYRAESIDRAQALSERERGRARLDRFIGAGAAYTPGT